MLLLKINNRTNKQVFLFIATKLLHVKNHILEKLFA